MKRLLFAPLLFLGLAACPGPDAGPPQTASSSVPKAEIIEQARLRCEQSYKLSRTIGELGVDAGIVHGPMATKAADLDRKLFAGLGKCRAAYNALDSAGLKAAADAVDGLADQVQALVKGGGK